MPPSGSELTSATADGLAPEGASQTKKFCLQVIKKRPRKPDVADVHEWCSAATDVKENNIKIRKVTNSCEFASTSYIGTMSGSSIGTENATKQNRDPGLSPKSRAGLRPKYKAGRSKPSVKPELESRAKTKSKLETVPEPESISKIVRYKR
ncbi:hypothetical protein EVAR_31487_1 [Eumeta japonica]|uniref:Uncharacterized protein n=1 Tax=Eumeta variegata TaxID=151549 RepID=A0A4C1WCT4_EUMVA|nr:hypothetical protein EVAR_31487_1 [Eumeta japonica]